MHWFRGALSLNQAACACLSLAMCHFFGEIALNLWRQGEIITRYISYWMNKITSLSFYVHVFFVAGSTDMRADFCNSNWRDCLCWESTSKVQWNTRRKILHTLLHTDDQSHVNKLSVDAWRWPKSLFVRFSSHGWGGWHCWRHSEDKALHSLGHAWATRLAPDLHTVHTLQHLSQQGATHSLLHTSTHAHSRWREDREPPWGNLYSL